MNRSTVAVSVALALVAVLAALAIAASEATSPPVDTVGYVLDHELDDIDGEAVDLGGYRGQVLLLVNVASKCGYTSQYEGLENLYERYRARGFAVLGFPSNDFGGQEPGTNAEIKDFCRATWGVKFPMFGKIRVRGEGKHPLYSELVGLPAPIGGEVAWNFQKYLVDRKGMVRAKLPSRVAPESEEMVQQVEALLAEAQ